MRTLRAVSSVTSVLPPQVGHLMRRHAASGVAARESAAWKTTAPVGGQRSLVMMPTGRAQSRQAISATTTRCCRGRGRVEEASSGWCG
jgi:hypothetical protein